MLTKVKTAAELQSMRQSGRMLATILALVGKAAQPGVTGLEIDLLAHRELKALGGRPACLGYQGYPKSICISIEEQIVHAIPDRRPFEKGQIIGFDFGVNYRGMITDAAISVAVDGTDDPARRRLLEGTSRALQAGIAAIHGPTHVGRISQAVEKVLEKYRLGIVTELVGHGVGHHFHEEPNIPNFSEPNPGMLLKPGMTIAIEPMAALGKGKIKMGNDGWTVLTADGSTAAHFEHTVLITDDGAEILTQI